MAGRLTPGPPRRRSALALPLLVVLVTAVHLWLADGALQVQMGWGAAQGRDQRPPRIEVALVRRLQQSAPPPPAPIAPLPRAAAPLLAPMEPFALAASAPALAMHTASGSLQHAGPTFTADFAPDSTMPQVETMESVPLAMASQPEMLNDQAPSMSAPAESTSVELPATGD